MANNVAAPIKPMKKADTLLPLCGTSELEAAQFGCKASIGFLYLFLVDYFYSFGPCHEVLVTSAYDLNLCVTFIVGQNLNHRCANNMGRREYAFTDSLILNLLGNHVNVLSIV